MEGKIFVDFAKVDYSCPHCNEKYLDEKDKMCERLNKSQEGWLKLRCSNCKKFFGYTVSMVGQAVGFVLQ